MTTSIERSCPTCGVLKNDATATRCSNGHLVSRASAGSQASIELATKAMSRLSTTIAAPAYSTQPIPKSVPPTGSTDPRLHTSSTSLRTYPTVTPSIPTQLSTQERTQCHDQPVQVAPIRTLPRTRGPGQHFGDPGLPRSEPPRPLASGQYGYTPPITRPLAQSQPPTTEPSRSRMYGHCQNCNQELTRGHQCNPQQTSNFMDPNIPNGGQIAIANVDIIYRGQEQREERGKQQKQESDRQRMANMSDDAKKKANRSRSENQKEKKG